jgi:hypothetical protein
MTLMKTMSISLSLCIALAAGCSKKPNGAAVPGEKGAAVEAASAAADTLPGSVKKAKRGDVALEILVPDGMKQQEDEPSWELEVDEGTNYSLDVFDAGELPESEADAIGRSGYAVVMKKVRSKATAETFELVGWNSDDPKLVNNVTVVWWVKSGDAVMKCIANAEQLFASAGAAEKAGPLDVEKESARLLAYCKTLKVLPAAK